MTTFIRFEDANEGEVWINPERVVSIREVAEGDKGLLWTEILTERHRFLVEMPMNDAVNALARPTTMRLT